MLVIDRASARDHPDSRGRVGLRKNPPFSLHFASFAGNITTIIRSTDNNVRLTSPVGRTFLSDA